MVSESASHPGFSWDDPLLLSQQLTVEERQVQFSARTYCQQKLLPRLFSAGGLQQPDRALLREMGEHRFLGIALEDYGCGGLSHVAYGLVAHEFEAVDSIYRATLTLQSSLVMYPLWAYGSQEQKDRYLPRLALGESVGGFCLAEADASACFSSIKARAETTPAGFRLNGCKRLTQGPLADFFVVWALDDAGDVRAFLLDRGLPGISFPAGGEAGQLLLQDVMIAESARLPAAKGLKTALSCLNMARYAAAWGCLGAADYCWQVVRHYVLDRRQFGRPLADDLQLQSRLADMQTGIALGLQAALRIGRLLDQGLAAPEMIALIARHNCAQSLEVAGAAAEILAGSGISDEKQVRRHLMNLAALDAEESAPDVQHNHAEILVFP